MILNRGENDILHRPHSYQIMSAEEIAKGKQSSWPGMEITGSIRSLSPSIWRLTHLTALYLNDNCLKTIPPSISMLSNLQKLDLANNKLRSLPPELGDLIELRELALSNNLLRSLPYELGKLFQLNKFCLKGNQLGPEFTTIYNEERGPKKLLEFMLDNLSVNLAPPPLRPWLSMGQIADRGRSTPTFTVMCYNVLCDRYATRAMYGYCPQWALNWEYRKKGILDEVRHYGADIITLQEVEMEQFYNYFLRELKRDGYDGIFSPKSRAKTMPELDRKRVDGCAIFYRTSKFTMVREHLVEFNQLAMSMSQRDVSAACSRNLLNRVMPKDNIALAALLETKDGVYDQTILPSDPARQQILVCTAHIHWDPEFCDVKLIQSMMLMDQLKRLVDQELSHETFTLQNGGLQTSASTSSLQSLNSPLTNGVAKKASADIQLLLCGDLNSLPDSGVVEFLSKGRISTKHRDFKEFDYSNALMKMLGHSTDKEYYTHAFKLSSAINPEVMPYTNYTHDFKGMIDYIFYPKDSMQVLGFLGPIDSHWLKENKVIGCPQPHLTSDHFSLVVELAMPLPVGSAHRFPLAPPNPQPQHISNDVHHHHGTVSPMTAAAAAAVAANSHPAASVGMNSLGGNNNFMGPGSGSAMIGPSGSIQQQQLHQGPPHHLQGPPPPPGPPGPPGAGAPGPFGMPSLMNYPPPNNSKLQSNNNMNFMR